MANHIQFMKSIIEKPIYVLRKDMVASRGGKKKSGISDVVDSYIKEIAEEKVFVSGSERKTKRLFAHSSDGGDYANVGWIVNGEMLNCMICGTAFGFFTYPHHCKACGNIVCQSCSSNQAEIYEIEQLGPKRVCNQCFWGQEVVYAVPKLPEKTPEPIRVKEPEPEPEIIETPEMIERRVREEQQREFQRDALARIQQGSLLKKGASVSLPRSTSPTRAGSSQRGKDKEDIAYTTNPLKGGGSASASAPSTPKHGSSNGSMVSPLTGGEADQDRVKKLLSFGEMTTVTPTPGFVIKTKRNDMTKIFINVCTAPSIPYKTEESGNENGFDMDKVVYMLVGPPLESVNEKDGEYCIIYDVAVHPDEVYVCSIDSTGEARTRLCNQALELIALHYQESLDPSYKILRLSGNYKGKSEGGKLKIQHMVVPAREAFYSLLQVMTRPTDLDGFGQRPSLSRTPSAKNVNPMARNPSIVPRSSESGAADSRSSISPSRQSMASVMGGGDDYLARASGVVVSIDDSISQSLDTSLKVTIKPLALARKITDNNFTHVLKDLNDYQYNLKEVVLSPEAGFVIASKRGNRTQSIFINVCHHPLVGLVSMRNGAKAVEGFQVPCPFIIGAIDNAYEVEDPVLLALDSDGSNAKALVITIVIPTAVLLETIADSTGELRDKLSIDLLEKLSAQNIEFDSAFVLPNVHGGYVGSALVIPPVINLTEGEKEQYLIAFVGKLFKQGHNVKSWKQRLVHIVETKLKYFEVSNPTFKGDFNIDDCTVTYVQNSECNAPEGTFPFKLTNFSSGGEFMYCYALTAELRELFSLIIITKTRQLSVVKELINVPEITTGWLMKQGRGYKSWKKRFFVLSYGVLKYYDKDGQSAKGSGEKELGSVPLVNTTVKIVVNTGSSKSGSEYRFSINDTRDNKELLLLQAETMNDRIAWFDAMKKHALYANKSNGASGK